MTRNFKFMMKLILIIMFVFTILLVTFSYKQASFVEQPVTKNGNIDLSNWDFEKNGNVVLNGYWEFYWNQLLDPADFVSDKLDKTLMPTGFIKVPSAWEGVLNNTSITSKGVGTYRLKIKIKPEYSMYGIKTTNIRMANKLYVNGRLAAKSGNPALSHDESITGNVPYTAFFPSEKEYIDIIIQVSDFNYQIGGIVQYIYFGKEKAISDLNLKMVIFDIVAVSTLMMTSLYFFGVFYFRRKEISLFYFSTYCMIFAFFISTSNEKVFMQLFPSVSFMIIIKLKMIFLFLCFSCIYLFIHKNGEHFLPKKILNFYLSVYLLFDIFILITPVEVNTKYESFMYLTALSGNICIQYFLIKAVFRKNYGNLGKTGARLLCLSSVFASIHSICHLLYNSAILHNSELSLIAILLYVLTISIFISKRHSDAYNTVEALSESLIRSDKIKDEFLINTSHELKTPLHGIINITQGILDRNVKNMQEKHLEDLNYVITIAQRLSSLINDIIDFQSIKSNSLYLNTKIIDLNAPVQAVVEVFRRMYESKKISIVNNILSQKFFVVADENRVRQILYNLLGNALKYTEQGEVHIYAAKRDDFVLITIQDTGIGIKKELHEVIFKYFEHTSKVKPSEYSATGLGLPIAWQLTTHMGGKLWLEKSEIGKGSTFCFTLPILEDDMALCIQESAVASDLNTNSNISDCSSQDKIQKKADISILVVDDEISNIKVVQDIFSEEDCEIITAYSGQQALEAVKNNRSIALVLLDVMMPDMSGFEACRRIREEYTLFDLPIVLLTVKNSPEDIAAGLDSGANDLLSKPFDARELKARVKTLLELKQSVRNTIHAETAFLLSQIKPHFIFNALSVITSLCYVNGVQAAKLLEEFSNYLRCSFDFDPYSSFVSLEKELSMVHSYVEIEKVRFGERLMVNYDINEDLNICNIPALILQPLVENAIRHGLMKKLNGGNVEIKAWVEAESIKITVKDNGVGISSEKLKSMFDNNKEVKRVGIRNIHQRLLNMYGQGLHIESQEGEGTLVELRLPYNKH